MILLSFFEKFTFCFIESLNKNLKVFKWMFRGNHEDYNTSLLYGLFDECYAKYGQYGEMVVIGIFNLKLSNFYC